MTTTTTTRHDTATRFLAALEKTRVLLLDLAIATDEQLLWEFT